MSYIPKSIAFSKKPFKRTKWLWVRVPLRHSNFRFRACFEHSYVTTTLNLLKTYLFWTQNGTILNVNYWRDYVNRTWHASEILIMYFICYSTMFDDFIWCQSIPMILMEWWVSKFLLRTTRCYQKQFVVTIYSYIKGDHVSDYFRKLAAKKREMSKSFVLIYRKVM